MVLQPCPECGSQVSSLAVSCPSCGCPASAAKFPTADKPKKSKPAGHVGTVPGCLAVLLAIGVVAVVFREPHVDSPPTPRAPARRAAGSKPSPSQPPSFDAQLAAKGKELHARLLSDANAYDWYLSGSLLGAVTADPKASIAVPLDAWNEISDEERDELMHYAASLIEPMRRDPLAFCQIPASAPVAGMVLENAGRMGPRSWVIYGGRLDGSDILTDEVVASGANHQLGPRPETSPPEEIIAQLLAGGVRADSPWHRSNFDGIWNAVLRSTFGDNEVSCLLESSSPGTVEAVELEAEIYRPGQHEAAVFRAFVQAAQIVCDEPGLVEAIEARADWTSGEWRLAQESYALGGGYGLALRFR